MFRFPEPSYSFDNTQKTSALQPATGRIHQAIFYFFLFTFHFFSYLNSLSFVRKRSFEWQEFVRFAERNRWQATTSATHTTERPVDFFQTSSASGPWWKAMCDVYGFARIASNREESARRPERSAGAGKTLIPPPAGFFVARSSSDFS